MNDECRFMKQCVAYVFYKAILDQLDFIACHFIVKLESVQQTCTFAVHHDQFRMISHHVLGS